MRKIRWVRTILVVFLVLAFVGGSLGVEKDSKNVNLYETPIQNKYISLKVITKCLGEILEPPLPTYCDIVEQNIVFENVREKIKKEIVSSAPSNAKLKDYEISSITFYENKKGQVFTEIYYANGGNCVRCEYFELYNDKGNLVATDRDKLNLDSESKKFSEILKKYRNFKQKLGLYKVREIFISKENLEERR